MIQPKEIGSTYRSHSGGVQQSSAVFHTTVYALGSLSEDNKVYFKHAMYMSYVHACCLMPRHNQNSIVGTRKAIGVGCLEYDSELTREQ